MLKSGRTVDGVIIDFLSAGSEERVVLLCDGCGKETIAIWHNYTKAQESRNHDGLTYCRSCSNKRNGVAKLGKPIKGGPRPSIYGKLHHSWRGGRFVGSDGYVQVYVGPRKHRKEHMLVMEKALGRPLSKREVVHHIDLHKLHNELTNLLLLGSESEHREVHNSLYNLDRTLIEHGLIGFDRETNTYVAVGKLRELLGQPEEANQQPS